MKICCKLFYIFRYQLEPIDYTTTEYGNCSTQCGEGLRTITNIKCQISSTSSFGCEKEYHTEPCNKGDCPRTHLN